MLPSPIIGIPLNHLRIAAIEAISTSDVCTMACRYNDAMAELDEVPGRSYPDERELDALQLSFLEFCDKARELYTDLQYDTNTDDEEKHAAQLFYRFVLAGRTCTDNDVPRHITVNALDNLPKVEQFTVTRDYDSMIGVSHDLPYTSHLALSPVPPFRSTLKTPNHMKADVYLDVLLFVVYLFRHLTSIL